MRDIMNDITSQSEIKKALTSKQMSWIEIGTFFHVKHITESFSTS